MAYTAWSVVFGEQPTAAKWNQLGQNDAGFKDGTNIDDLAILNRHIANAAIKHGQLNSNIFHSVQGGVNQNPMPTTEADVNGSSDTLNLDVASKVMFIWGARMQGNTSLTANLYLNIDGSNESESVQLRQATGSAQNHYSLSRTITKNLTSGAHTIKLRGVATASNAAVVNEAYWHAIIISQ